MTRLTLEQRARRRTTRINNRLRARYPLIADQLLTTVEEQAEELHRLDADFEVQQARRDEFHADQLAGAAGFRQAVAEVVTADELAELDAYRQHTYPPSSEYELSFWRRQHGIIVDGRPAGSAWTLARWASRTTTAIHLVGELVRLAWREPGEPRLNRQHDERVPAIVAELLALVGPELDDAELAELADAAALYPDSAEYQVDLWRRQLRHLN